MISMTCEPRFLTRCSFKNWSTGKVEKPGSAEHGIQAHVLAHVGSLLLVVHQELAVAIVLTLLAGLCGDDEPPHRPAGQFPPTGVTLAEPDRGFFAVGLDDLVFERDEELAVTGVALAGATTGKLAVDPARLVPLGPDHMEATVGGDLGVELDV